MGRALAVLEFLAGRRGPQRLSVIARELDLPKSSCFTILSTLEAEGYVRQEEQDDAWTLTLSLYYLGMRVAENGELVPLAEPLLQQLRDTTGLTSHLGLLEGRIVRYALKVQSPNFVQFDTSPGRVAQPHLTAIGRAVAAHLPSDQLAAILNDYRFEGGTENAFRSRASFERALAQIRRDGYAIEDQEETLGVRCVAAPVTDRLERCIGAVGVTGLVAEIEDPAATAEHVVATARRLSERL